MIEINAHTLLGRHIRPEFSMLEMGNQVMDLENIQGLSAKKYFTDKGFKHTSIDINGYDGALPLDMNYVCNNKLGDFDIITDFGTIEHVENLYQVLANMFFQSNKGTVIIHKNPKTGHFPNGQGHNCFHFFSVEFWKEYAKAIGAEILELFEWAIYHNEESGVEVCCVMKITQTRKFIPYKEFQELQTKYIYKS